MPDVLVELLGVGLAGVWFLKSLLLLSTFLSGAVFLSSEPLFLKPPELDWLFELVLTSFLVPLFWVLGVFPRVVPSRIPSFLLSFCKEPSVLPLLLLLGVEFQLPFPVLGVSLKPKLLLGLF